MLRQRGEIATTLTLIGLGIMAVGSLLGSWAVQKGPLKFLSRAEVSGFSCTINSTSCTGSHCKVEATVCNNSKTNQGQLTSYLTCSNYATNCSGDTACSREKTMFGSNFFLSPGGCYDLKGTLTMCGKWGEKCLNTRLGMEIWRSAPNLVVVSCSPAQEKSPSCTAPVPTATTAPQPTATTAPAPTATTAPQPTATTAPQPTATTAPAPTATLTPTLTPTATLTPPVATLTPTATLTPPPACPTVSQPQDVQVVFTGDVCAVITPRVTATGTGDLNSDGTVNTIDLMLFRNSVGTKRGETGYNSLADLNSDGMINALDGSLLLTRLGK